MKFQISIKNSVLLFVVFLLFSFANDKVQKKIIRNKNFDIHFFVSLKEKNTHKDKTYFWYKSGEVHQSFGASGGELLHLEYIKYFKTNQLAEKGSFDYGLKVGVWKQWYDNGSLKEKINWKNGEKNGTCFFYDDKGLITTSGLYKNNIKNKVWVNYIKKDTTWYKDGKPFKEDPKIIKKRTDSIQGKKSFFKRLFQKKDSTQKKKPFFKRIFSKKKDT